MPEFEAQMPKGTDPTPAKLFSFFISRVRANLHLVLCFSPIGEKFRQRARAFPGLSASRAVVQLQTSFHGTPALRPRAHSLLPSSLLALTLRALYPPITLPRSRGPPTYPPLCAPRTSQ